MLGYEDVPYRGRPIPFSAPAALALAARVQGGPRLELEDGLRVLELGCGDGANCVPLAFHHPGWTVAGVDLSEGALGRARETAGELGLENLSLIRRDLASFASDRPWDVVIAHGVYSWIDPERRAALVRLVRRALSPAGLAYVSFNAQPGWGVRGRVRDALTRSPVASLAEARGRLAGLADVLEGVQNTWSAFLVPEVSRAREAPDHYLAHEYLAPDNDAFWLGDVVDRFSEVGLRYVGDAAFNRPEVWVSPELRERVAALVEDRIAREELIDLCVYRQFRASVFAREDADWRPPAGPELLSQVRLASPIRRRNDPFDLSPGAEEIFDGPRGSEVRVGATLSKAALLTLAERYPLGLSLAELVERSRAFARAHGFETGAEGEDELREGLWTLWGALEVELRLEGPELRTEAGARPLASALSRLEARRAEVLSTPLHGMLPLEPVDREIVVRLDGTRTPGEVVSEIVEGVRAGEVELEGATGHPQRWRAVLEDRVERTITLLGFWGLVR